jgi:outer membrane protein assembly factor BamB
MNTSPDAEMTPAKPLRLWPGVLIVAVQWILRYAVPPVFPDAAQLGILGGLAGGALLLVWWLGFSRAPWRERIAVVGVMIVGAWATRGFVHASVAGGMMGMMLTIQIVPLLSLALVVWAAASRGRGAGGRWAGMVVATAVPCAAMALVRTGGISAGGASDLHWRWSLTPEEKLLAEAKPAARTATAAPAIAANVPRWPGFRGAERDGVVRGGVQLAEDWASSPPVEIWRRPVGPGWSSFAVDGDFFYTQEQRGEEERVACYRVATGAPVWSHAEAARFWESNAGAGPRGTPMLAHGRVYSVGATGLLNALDARTGAVVWSRNAATELGRKVPDWGFACSPLVIGDRVIVALAGWLAAYDAATGRPLWTGAKAGWGYSSPHRAVIAGAEQIVLLNGAGAVGVAFDDGKPLWSHEWKSDGIVQPAVLADGDILIGSGSGLGAKIGVRRLAVARGAGGWTAEERWTSLALKPYFNDFAVHAGHAYGFDGNGLACIDLADGVRKWKGGRYGHGQLVLLAGQDLLIVLAEAGELALVRATPERFAELARVRALTGKTWNHPVLAGDVLLVRNSEEMAAFRLAPARQ